MPDAAVIEPVEQAEESESVSDRPATGRFQLRRAVIFAAKFAIAGSLIYWLVSSGRLRWETLASLKFGQAACLLIACEVIMMVGPLVRWYLLARGAGIGVSLGRSLQIGCAGYFATLFIPAGLGLDTARFIYASQCDNQGRLSILSTLVMDRALGLMGLFLTGCMLATPMLLQSDLPTILPRLLLLNWLLLCGSFAGLWVASSPRIARLFPETGRLSLLRRAAEAFNVYRNHKLCLAAGLMITVFGHLGAIGAAYCGFKALEMPASFGSVSAITPLVNLSGIIPLAPLGLGVTDSVSEELYAAAGLSGGSEVNMLLRVATVALSAVCGIAFLNPMVPQRSPS